jgi:hypothetical protein
MVDITLPCREGYRRSPVREKVLFLRKVRKKERLLSLSSGSRSRDPLFGRLFQII